MTDESDPVVHSMARHPAGKKKAVEIDVEDLRALTQVTSAVDAVRRDLNEMDEVYVDQISFRVYSRNGYMIGTTIWQDDAWRVDLSSYGEVDT